MSERNPTGPGEPWRQRLIRSLLYGRNVDRNVKARARVGFAILAFAAVYAVIGGRLVMFAVGADGHAARALLPRLILPAALLAATTAGRRRSAPLAPSALCLYSEANDVLPTGLRPARRSQQSRPGPPVLSADNKNDRGAQ